MAEKKAPSAPSDDRVPFGIPALDTMLDGGLMPRRPYLVVGPAGTGKTSLALQFLCEGVRRGESALYVTLEDPPNEIRRNHRGLQPELDRVEVFDAIPDVMRYERIPFKDISSVRDVLPFSEVSEQIRQTPEFTSTEVTIAAMEQFLRTQTYRRRYTRMVIDSLTALQYFCMKGLEPVLGAQTFLRFLSDLRVTTVLTVESPLEGAETPERMLARGEIRMFRWEKDGATVRAIGVEKFRGSSHDTRMHPYRIGPKGIDINLAVTVSRDTRDIAEPAHRLIAPALEAPLAELEAVAPPTLHEGIQDLLELGVDVGPLRTEVEAALAAVRSGRPERSAVHLSRISSLAVALSQVAVLLPGPAAERAASDPELFRRMAERADRARVGSPPVKWPPASVLRADLEKVLELLPPVASATVPVRAVAGTETVPFPATPVPEGPERGPAEPAGFPTALPEPSAPVVAPPPEGADRRRPSVRGRPPPPKGIAEPPPLPASETLGPLAPASLKGPVGALLARAEPGSEGTTAVAPPLPEPLPLPTEGEPVAPAPAAKPAVRRRRRTTATKASARSAPAGEEGAAAVAPAKPRRRVVRRKKAPPVVSATAEPLPPSEEPAPVPTPEASSPPPEGP